MHPTLAVTTLFLATSALATDVVIDASHDRRSIAPTVYGMIGGDELQLSRMGVTVRRHGGNDLSRFNWKTSATNTGGDGHFFQKQPRESADDWVSHSNAALARAMMELPLVGYVSDALDAGTEHCGFSVAKYGPQQSVDPADSDCGDGVAVDGGLMSSDPLDTSVAVDETWTKEWVTHLVTKFGPASDMGVRYYNLGNQPALWNQTHRDVHPQPASYAEIGAKFEAHAKAVKDADPSALTLGPAAWGWLAYFDSAAGDRAVTGVDFIPFYLKTAQVYEATHGRRLLDYLDIHVYPQATGIPQGVLTPAAKAMRLRSTKILWDPNYTVESWETCCYGNGVLRILPRMHEWIDAYYPGTGLAISAYAFGAIDDLNGALAEADVLGILGREGVDIATLDGAPTPGSVGEDAFQLYRRYDGANGHFGDTSIRATSSAPDALSSFAAFDAQGRVTAVLINKDPNFAAPVALRFTGVGAEGPYRIFEFGSGGRLAPAGTGYLSDGTLSHVVAPYTASLIEFTPTAGIGPAAVDEPDAGTPDAGTPADGGTQAAPGQSSGCDATGTAGVSLLGLIAVLSLRRARRANSGR